MMWLRDLMAAVQVSLIAYLSAGAFLGLAYFDYFYSLVVIVAIGRSGASPEAPRARPTPNGVRATPSGCRGRKCPPGERLRTPVPPCDSCRLVSRRDLNHWPGVGAAFALLLLLVPEAMLHTDGFFYRYRAVFATGRAMDKLHYVEAIVPTLLIVGNSRVDNGFDPGAIAGRLGAENRGRMFNFGLPGSDTRTLFGLLTRLDRKGLLGPSRIEAVVIGLDEGYLQPADALGYEVFFADRATMLEKGEYRDLARSLARLWGYSDNLKELREPAKLERFIRASRDSVEPIGGEPLRLPVIAPASEHCRTRRRSACRRSGPRILLIRRASTTSIAASIFSALGACASQSSIRPCSIATCSTSRRPMPRPSRTSRSQVNCAPAECRSLVSSRRPPTIPRNSSTPGT